MKKSIFFAILLLTTTVFIFSCNKKKDECKAGKGGSLTFVVFPQHHGASVVSRDNYRDTVYIKYNTSDAPGTNPSNYDLVVFGEENENHIHVPEMGCGNYYIYAVGYDTMIQQRVKGGIPFSTSQKSGEIDINVPVSE